jgi:hypothetical protein
MTNFVNLNPHPMRMRVNVANTAAEPDASDIVVEARKSADGKPMPARVSTTPGGTLAPIGGMAAYDRTSYGAVEGLPESQPDTVYLVSALIAGRPEVAGRDDVFVPGTGPKDGTVRTAEGQVYAVTRIVKAG